MHNVILHCLPCRIHCAGCLFLACECSRRRDVLSRGVAGHLVLIPLALHAYLLAQDVFAGGGFNLSMTNALSMIIWLTLAVYWIARFFYPIGGLQALVLPLAAIIVLLPEFFPTAHQLTNTGLFAFKAHITAAMLAYSLFTIAMLHAVLISQVENRLHHAMMPRVLQSLPPLMTMETLLFRMIGFGFVLLTLTLASVWCFPSRYSARPWSSITRFCLASFPGGIRRVAVGTSFLWLARAHRSALDSERFRVPAAGISGQQVRPGSVVAKVKSRLHPNCCVAK